MTERKENLPNFLDMLKLLEKISKDRQLQLDSFDSLCSSNCLDIKNKIKIHTKNLLRQNNHSFKGVKGYDRIKVYIATLFVSYVSLGFDFKDIIKRIKNLLEKSIKDARIKQEFKKLVFFLSKMIKTIERGHFKVFLTAAFLNEKQRDEFMTNYYKLKITRFLEELNENFYSFITYNVNLEDLLDPAIYIIKSCNDEFSIKYRAARYGAACYFIFSMIKKLQRINKYGLKKDYFFRPVGSSITSLQEHLERIYKRLDYNEFTNLFKDKFEFIERIEFSLIGF